MAAEFVGGALLSAFLQVLFDRLASKEILDFFRGKKAVPELLEELKRVLSSANSLLDDAEEKQITDEKVKNWLDELKEAIYDADDLVDTIDGEALRCKLEGKSKTVYKNFFTSFYNTIKHEAERILRKLNSLVKQNDDLGLRDIGNKSGSQRPPAPLVEQSDVYGRDADKEEIVDLLLSNDTSDNKISVIPIVGMGGIGKTTLAQLVFDDSRVKEHFELRVWVTVSEEFDNIKIMKTIIEEVTSQKCYIEEPFQLQRKLKEALTGKKFLFIHDDVWNENRDRWNSLMSSYQSGAEGSKIIVTTRSTTVASIVAVPIGKTHYLKELTPDDCWLLFVKHAFGSNADLNADKNFETIGREIVNKCKGLPLAIKSLGGILRSMQDLKKWENILECNVWKLYKKESDNILPALWLSYRHLPANLKRCFAYCSIFPKGYKYEKEKLILLWMAEGLLQSDSEDATMEELGEEYLQDLLSRSLFQRSSQGDSFLLMHDLVHDLAMFVSGEFCFRLDKSIDLQDLPSKRRHLSYRKGSYDLNKLKGLSKAKRLRTFLALPLSRSTRLVPKLHTVPCDALLKSGVCLRVLSLCQSSFKKLPDSVGNMKHLRYLDLSDSEIEELPKSICTLYSLQTLLLSRCLKLTHLPEKMESLINLRHLDIEGVTLKEVTLQLSNLKNLRTFPQMVLSPGTSGFKIKEIKELRYLGGVLKISGLEHVVDGMEAKEADLNDKKSLSYLSLEWNLDLVADTSEKEKKILDELRPHTNLKGLEITSYRGTTFSGWVGDSSFSNMVSVYLKGCKNCWSLPPLGQLRSLEDLNIDGLNHVVSIGDEFYGSGPNSFRSLRRLTLQRMNQWKEWSFSEANLIQEGGIFPRLTQIKLEDCQKLEVGLPGKLPSLEDITMERCLKMEDLLPGTQQTIVTFPSLVSISLKNCPALKSLPECGSHSKVRSLQLWYCKQLFVNSMNWNLQRRFSSLERLEITGWECGSFPENGMLPTTLRRMKIDTFSNLHGLNGEAFQQLTSLEYLEIICCNKLQCLPGIPPSLEELPMERSSEMTVLAPVTQQITATFPSLVSISLINCPVLESLPECGSNSKVKSLQLRHCQKLFENRMHWELQRRFPSLERLEITGWEDETFPDDGLLPTTLRRMEINSCSKLQGLNGKAFQQLTSLEHLEIICCNKLQCLPEKMLPTSLSRLSINECHLLKECYQKDREDSPKIADIASVSIH